MHYKYFEIIDKDKIFVAEIGETDDIYSLHVKIYALDVYYVKENNEVIYPIICAFDIKFTDNDVLPPIFDNKKIINNILSKIQRGVLPAYNPRCNKIIYQKEIWEKSIINKVLKYEALSCIYGIYDIDRLNNDKWIVRRNGNELFSFNPNEFLDYYDPDYDGYDYDSYLGDSIIVKYMPESLFATDRCSMNYLSYKLNFLGKLYCIEHGCKPSYYDN